MTFLKEAFGVPREARSNEFYRNNRWMGQTPAEARFVHTLRVVVVVVAGCWIFYRWLP